MSSASRLVIIINFTVNAANICVSVKIAIKLTPQFKILINIKLITYIGASNLCKGVTLYTTPTVNTVSRMSSAAMYSPPELDQH